MLVDTNAKKLTDDDIENKELVLEMLKYENELYFSDEGQN